MRPNPLRLYWLEQLVETIEGEDKEEEKEEIDDGGDEEEEDV